MENKKHFILFLLLSILFILNSCSIFNGSKYKDLYHLTDKYVELLYTKYESYGLLGGEKEETPDGKYQVLPIGRLINVKIMANVDDSVYEQLCYDISLHYKDDQRVHNVYIAQAGTVMIDCRKQK